MFPEKDRRSEARVEAWGCPNQRPGSRSQRPGGLIGGLSEPEAWGPDRGAVPVKIGGLSPTEPRRFLAKSGGLSPALC